jgi:1-acyl-sn-glycerol-3-phosphate acyltransferase
MTSDRDREYARLLGVGRSLHPGVRIGRPGRARTYWATIAAMRVLRLKWSVEVHGDDNVESGSAILVGNHVSAWDPVAAVMSHWWRVTAFTKVEVYQRRGAVFFRLMGQIPLRRGDEAATDWALAMAGSTLADGNKVGVYPEGTRSPDPTRLHRLHPRVLVPLIRENPSVPVHAIHTEYPDDTGFRRRIIIRLSPALALDLNTADEDLVEVIREALLALGGQEYVDESAAAVKRRAARPQA